MLKVSIPSAFLFPFTFDDDEKFNIEDVILDAAENIFNPDDMIAQPEAVGTAASAAIVYFYYCYLINFLVYINSRQYY